MRIFLKVFYFDGGRNHLVMVGGFARNQQAWRHFFREL
jgi:hypothetical protein